jgi:hypothetical protein
MADPRPLPDPAIIAEVRLLYQSPSRNMYKWVREEQITGTGGTKEFIRAA